MHSCRLLAAALAVAAVLGGASASSLGNLEDVSLGTVSRALDVCQAETDLLDTSGNVIPLSTPDLYEIGAVRLSNLTGDCAGTAPIVVVVGQDPWLVNSDEVLAVQRSFSSLETITDPIHLDVSSGDVLDLLELDHTRVATDVRTAFCPSSRTCP